MLPHDLLSQVADGDARAFEALYTRYTSRIRAYLRKRLNDPDVIDEVLNDVMLVIWQDAAACPADVPLLALWHRSLYDSQVCSARQDAVI